MPTSDEPRSLSATGSERPRVAQVLVDIPLAVMTTAGIRDMLERHGRELLARARAALTERLDVVEEVVDGHARDALLAACERHAPVVLVVGSRGLGGFQELLLGSTSVGSPTTRPARS